MIRFDHTKSVDTATNRNAVDSSVVAGLVVWMVVPTLWLSVWVLACLLHAWNNVGADSTGIATLGWLPSLIAGLLTSLYLSSRGILRQQASNLVVHSIAGGVVVIFFATQVYLGGWANGLLILLVQIASELQLLLHGWMSGSQSSASSDGTAHVSGPMPIASTPSARESTDLGTEPIGAPLNSAPSNPVRVDLPPTTVNKSNEALVVDHSSLSSGSGNDNQTTFGGATAQDDGQTRNHVESVEDCEADLESESEMSSVPWLQQMTRANYELDSGDEDLVESAKQERVEWFYRHQWQPSEVQVELHCLFQPPFARKPRLQVQVVEGTGEVTIGDGLAHGVRLQLKRRSDAESSIDGPEAYSVVWLEAIGPVE